MTLDTLIIGSGAFVALLPFLGFPNSWDTTLLFLAGIFVVGLGINVRRRRGAEETMKRLSARDAQAGKSSGAFAESSPATQSGALFTRHEEREMGGE